MPFKQDAEQTPILFRRAKKRDGGEVFALFPTVPGTIDPYTCSCYAHVGQHSSADPHYCVATSRKAKPEEYASLKRELESAPYGYKLKVYSRLLPRFLDARKRELAVIDGTSGQDRDSYSDDQDRDSYTVEGE